MMFSLQAACFCCSGVFREERETNLYFNGKCLEPTNRGLRHPGYCEQRLAGIPVCMGLFETNGTNAAVTAFSAANAVKNAERELKDYLIPERQYIQRLWERAESGLNETDKNSFNDLSGGILFFTERYIYISSKNCHIFRQHENVFSQTTREPSSANEKSVDIIRSDLFPGDRYLICSAGIKQSLSNVDLTNLLSSGRSVQETVEMIVNASRQREPYYTLAAIVFQITQNTIS